MSDEVEPVPVGIDFGGFFEDNRRPIAQAIALTIRNADLANEATAEAMTRAYQRWDEVGIYANPAGWVYRVGINWAHSRRRRSWREVLRPAPVGPTRGSAPISGTADPDLEAALADLSLEQRSVVVMRYLLDWSEFQTAEALEIAPGTVKSRLSRALARLAVALEDSHESG